MSSRCLLASGLVVVVVSVEVAEDHAGTRCRQNAWTPTQRRHRPY